MIPTKLSILKNRVEASPIDYDRFERESPERNSSSKINKPRKHEIIRSKHEYLIKLKLPVDILIEFGHGQRRKRTVSMLVAAAAKREKQIMDYNSSLKEERAKRRAMNKSSPISSPTKSDSRIPLSNDDGSPRKKVNFDVPNI